MKHALATTLLFLAFNVGAQAPTPTINVGTTDPLTLSEWAREAAEDAQRLAQMIQQAQALNQLAQSQAAAIESLNEGDLDGIGDAIGYQLDAFVDYSVFMGELDDTFLALGREDLAADASLAEQQQRSLELASASIQMQQVLGQTRRMMNTAQWRYETMGHLLGLSTGNQSITSQLQTNNQAMNLMQGQLSDITAVLIAIASAEEERLLRDQEATEAQVRMRDQFMSDDWEYQRQVTDQEFDRTMNGDNILDQWNNGGN